MPARAKTSPPGPEMIHAVDDMIRQLEKISPDPSLVGKCPELPGIVLDKVEATVRDRKGKEYKEISRDYERRRAEYLQALVAHPVGRGLALLAVGAEGVAMMEVGRLPTSIQEVRIVQGRSMRGRRESYNCHHIVPRSVRPVSDHLPINHPTNFVVAKTTRRGRDQSENPHHFWHSLLLHPQTHNAPDKPIPVYVVRPLFPFYPPIARGYRNAEELRKKLASLGAPPLPEIWEKRILEFSKASKHRPYLVPKQFQEITRMFGDLFKSEKKDAGLSQQLRTKLAEQAAELAADFLPAGAYLNGKELPADHKPKSILPVVETEKELAAAISVPAPTKGRKKEPQRRATIQPKTRQQTI